MPVEDFQSFAASCAEMQAGAGQMLQPVAVQMFRVLVNTEGAAQAGGGECAEDHHAVRHAPAYARPRDHFARSFSALVWTHHRNESGALSREATWQHGPRLRRPAAA